MSRDESRSDETAVRELLGRAGPRPEVPPEELAAIRAVAHSEWSRRYARPVSRRSDAGVSRWALALAAGLVLAVVGLWWWKARPAPATTLAVVAALGEGGSLSVAGEEGARPAVLAEGLPAGAEVATGAAEGAVAALAWRDGQSVRIAPGSRLRLVSTDRIELLAGAVYLDSGEGASGPPAIAVATRLGTVVEVGTRFATRLVERDDTLRVRVRQGRVRVEAGGERHLAGPGEELTVDGEGTLWRTAVAAFGPEWEWVERAAPGFDAEGAPLAAYLEWVSYETGLRVVYADSRLEREAGALELLGAPAELSPRESLAAVLPASRLSYRIESGELRIERAAP
ncbi:MAG: FecR domain-containing protein [Thermoanaerobaculia bacterium]|nr:FecR domain-containing protein [Thermoanaerobaculia bacterium]